MNILLCDVTIVFSMLYIINWGTSSRWSLFIYCLVWNSVKSLSRKRTPLTTQKKVSSFIPGIEYLKLGDQRQFAADYGEQYEDIIQELSIYKVKMENILCKTDIKEQGHLPMDMSL